MDRMREKAHRFLNDVKLIKQGEHSACVENIKEGRLAPQAEPYCKCCYCFKVFIHSKFLMKHILRRHTDDLLSLHDKLVGISKANESNEQFSNKTIINILDEHFQIIRKELEGVKVHVANNLRDEISDDSNKVTQGTSVDDRSDTKIIGGKIIDKVVQSNFDEELEDVKLQISETEGFIKDLNAQVGILHATVKENTMLVENLEKKMSLEENKILQNQKSEFLKLRQCLISELNLERLQASKITWDEQYPDLKKELTRLGDLIELNNKQINSPSRLKEIETKFERQIINLIGSPKVPKTSNFRSIAKNVNTAPVKVKKMKEFRDYSISKNDIASNSLHGIPIPINELLEQKLQSLNIAPHTKRLPHSKFEKKIQLLNSEKELLCQRYEHFLQVRDNINSYADRKAYAKLRSKRSKKIKFAKSRKNSLDSVHQSYVNQSQLRENANLPKKQNSTGFDASDFHACGDHKSSSFRAEHDFDSKLDILPEEMSSQDLNEEFTNNISFCHLKKDNPIKESFVATSASLAVSVQKDFDDLSLHSLSSLSDKDLENNPSNLFLNTDANNI